MSVDRTTRGLATVRLALVVNGLMVAAKVTAGLLGNSYALVADGVESSLDVFGSVIVGRGLVVADRSPDDRYHFGYRKAESLAGAAVAVMLLIAALGIAVQAVREILTPHHVPAPYTLAVLIGVVVVKGALARRMAGVGHEIDSLALKTDAWHQRADAITSAAAFVGISVALIGGPAWAPADDVAALLASGIIAYNGVRLLRPALDDLMDRAPDRELLERIEGAANAVDGVRRIEKILARRAGVGHFVALHVEADPEMPLRRAHALGHDVKDAVLAAVPEVLDVLVHMEPENERTPG